MIRLFSLQLITRQSGKDGLCKCVFFNIRSILQSGFKSCMFISPDYDPTPSAVANPDGGWMDVDDNLISIGVYSTADRAHSHRKGRLPVTINYKSKKVYG